MGSGLLTQESAAELDSLCRAAAGPAACAASALHLAASSPTSPSDGGRRCLITRVGRNRRENNPSDAYRSRGAEQQTLHVAGGSHSKDAENIT